MAKGKKERCCNWSAEAGGKCDLVFAAKESGQCPPMIENVSRLARAFLKESFLMRVG